MDNKKNGQVILRLKNVSKQYDKTENKAMDGVSVDIDKGDFVFLTGPSGSGKTTFLKLLYKMESADEGDVYFFGREIKKIDRKKLRRKLGIVFQDYQLLQSKNVLENVMYPLECIGIKPSEAEKEAMVALKKMGIDEMIKKYPNELSGGQQQRVAIARAIVNNPEFLICDEPTGNLDNENGFAIMEHLKELNSSGTTILMTTHNEEILSRENDKRVISLKNGKIVSDIKPLQKIMNEKEEAKELMLMLGVGSDKGVLV